MTRYLVRRLVLLVFVVWGVASLTFAVNSMTSDPLTLMMYALLDDLSVLEDYRLALGLDRPVHIQYLDYLYKALHGDFGMSIRHREPALDMILRRLPNTLQLGGLAFILSLLVGFPLGTMAAVRRGTAQDGLIMLVALIGQAVPGFWLGILLILVFAVQLHWLPVAGSGGPEHLILPAITLAAYPTARNARLVRSSVLEVLGQEYVTTARAKGLRERTILTRHVLRNALIPVLTMNAMELGSLLGGAVITETVFGLPGMGRLTVMAIQVRDFPVVQAGIALIATMYVLANLLVDVLYVALDPRIRLVEER
jgi:peptide/nickel transport system permease protein